MLVCRWLFIDILFITTAAPHSVLISKPEIKDRKVNLALETVLEFNNKDNTNDIKFLDKVQNFIGNVKKVIDKNNIIRRDFDSYKLENFTDFIHNAIDILKKFNDDDLEFFFAILSEEVRKYHYRGCKFHELTENYGLRKYIAKELDDLKNIPARLIRNRITAIAKKIEEDKYNENEKELVDFINSLYRQDAVEKFRKILEKIDDYRLKDGVNMDLVEIVREGVRSIIFDHYTELNHNARTALKSKIDEYWKHLMELSKALMSELNAEEIKLRSFDTYVPNKIVNHTKDYNVDESKYKSESTKRIIDTTAKTKNDLYINLNEHIQVKYETRVFKHTTKEKVKKLTFMTLYPKFVSNHLTPRFRVAETTPVNIAKKKIKHSKHNKYLKADKESTTHKTKYKSTSKTRPTKKNVKKHKAKITTKQVYFVNNFDMKYLPLVYDKVTTETNRPKLTFLTLYPEFDFENDVTTKTQKSVKFGRKGGNQFVSTPVYNTMQTLWYEDIDQESAEQRAQSKENKRLLEIVTKKAYVQKKTRPSNRLKYEINLRSHKTHSKPFKRRSKKAKILFVTSKSKNIDTYPKIISRKDLKSFNKQNSETIVTQFRVYAIDTTKAHRKSNKDVDVSNEKYLIGDLIGDPRRSYDKRNIKGSKDSPVIDKHIITKLQQLEKELKVVKTQIKNDTVIINDLNSQVYRKSSDREDYNRAKKYNNKRKAMKEVVIDLSAQIDLDNAMLKRNTKDSKNTDNSNTFKVKSYVRDAHNTDTNKYKKEKDRKININKDTTIRDVYENYDRLSNEVKDEHVAKVKSHEAPYIKNKFGEKEHDRSTINRLDDNDDSVQFNDDDRFRNNKNKNSKYEFNPDSKDKYYFNKMDERKYDMDRSQFKRERNQEAINEVYKNKKPDYNMDKYRKEQEYKYYAAPKKLWMYESDADKNIKTRERIYDSDTNRDNYKKDKRIQQQRSEENVKQINQKMDIPNKDTDRKRFSNFENQDTNKTHLIKSNEVKLTDKVYKMHDIDSDKLLKTREKNYDTAANKYDKSGLVDRHTENTINEKRYLDKDTKQQRLSTHKDLNKDFVTRNDQFENKMYTKEHVNYIEIPKIVDSEPYVNDNQAMKKVQKYKEVTNFGTRDTPAETREKVFNIKDPSSRQDKNEPYTDYKTLKTDDKLNPYPDLSKERQEMLSRSFPNISRSDFQKKIYANRNKFELEEKYTDMPAKAILYDHSPDIHNEYKQKRNDIDRQYNTNTENLIKVREMHDNKLNEHLTYDRDKISTFMTVTHRNVDERLFAKDKEHIDPTKKYKLVHNLNTVDYTKAHDFNKEETTVFDYSRNKLKDAAGRDINYIFFKANEKKDPLNTYVEQNNTHFETTLDPKLAEDPTIERAVSKSTFDRDKYEEKFRATQTKNYHDVSPRNDYFHETTHDQHDLKETNISSIHDISHINNDNQLHDTNEKERTITVSLENKETKKHVIEDTVPYTDEKQKSVTESLDNKEIKNVNIGDKVPEGKGDSFKNEDVDRKISKENENYKETTDWVFSKSTGTSPKLDRTTAKIETTLPVGPTPMRRLFTAVTQSSTTFLAAASSTDTSPNVDMPLDSTIPQEGVASELDPFEAMNMGLAYDEMRRLNDPQALAVLRDAEEEDMKLKMQTATEIIDLTNNKPVETYMKKNESEQLEDEALDYMKQYEDFSNSSEPMGIAPGPDLPRPNFEDILI